MEKSINSSCINVWLWRSEEKQKGSRFPREGEMYVCFFSTETGSFKENQRVYRKWEGFRSLWVKIGVLMGKWNLLGFMVENWGFSGKMVIFLEKWGFRGILVRKWGKSRKEPGI